MELPAPSPAASRNFSGGKRQHTATRQVDLRGGEHLRPAFRAITADGTPPVLVLDDGTAIADAVAICCYLEELPPEPALVGRSARERALGDCLPIASSSAMAFSDAGGLRSSNRKAAMRAPAFLAGDLCARAIAIRAAGR